MSKKSAIERAYDLAREAQGRVTVLELGMVDQRSVGRFDAAVLGSLHQNLDPGLSSPLYLSSVLGWDAGPAESELLVDGNSIDSFVGVDLGGLRLMGGGQDLTFHRDLEPGVNVTVRSGIVDVSLKSASSGPLLLIIIHRTFADERGVLTECIETFIGREEIT